MLMDNIERQKRAIYLTGSVENLARNILGLVAVLREVHDLRPVRRATTIVIGAPC